MKLFNASSVVVLAMASGSAFACQCGPARTPSGVPAKIIESIQYKAVTSIRASSEPQLRPPAEDDLIGVRAGQSIDAPRTLARVQVIAPIAPTARYVDPAPTSLGLADSVAPTLKSPDGLPSPLKQATLDDSGTRADVAERRPPPKWRWESSGEPELSVMGAGGSLMHFGLPAGGGFGSTSGSGSITSTAPASSTAGVAAPVTMTTPAAPSGPSPTTYSAPPTKPSDPPLGMYSSRPSGSYALTDMHRDSGNRLPWDMHHHRGGAPRTGPWAAMPDHKPVPVTVSQYVPAYLPATRAWSDPNASAPRYAFFDSNGDGKADTYGVAWADLNHLSRSGMQGKPGVLSPPYTGTTVWRDPNAGAPVLGWFDVNGDGKPDAYGVVWADTRHTPAAQATYSWRSNTQRHSGQSQRTPVSIH